MRRAYNNQILFMGEYNVPAINLGSDHVSEHEWGIKILRQEFGVNTDLMGIAGKVITKVPKNLEWVEGITFPATKKKKWSGIFFGDTYDNERCFGDTPHDSTKMFTAWDEGNFCVLSTDKNEIDLLKKVFEAFGRNDTAYMSRFAAECAEFGCD